MGQHAAKWMILNIVRVSISMEDALFCLDTWLLTRMSDET